MSDRLLKLANELKDTHVPLQLDDSFALVRKDLTLKQLKAQVLIERSIPEEQIATWQLWIQGKQPGESQNVGVVYSRYARSEEPFLPVIIRSATEPRAILKLLERSQGQIYTFEQFPVRIGRYGRQNRPSMRMDFGVDEIGLPDEVIRSVSRHHVDIEFQPDSRQLQLICQSEQQGNTRLDDEYLLKDDARPLQAGQRLTLGTAEFTIDTVDIIEPDAVL